MRCWLHISPHWSVAAVNCRLYAVLAPHITTLIGCCSSLSFICGVGSTYRHTGRWLPSIVVCMRCWLPHIATLVGCCSPLPFICGVGFLISPHWSVAAVHCRLYAVLASSYRHTGRLLQSIVVYMWCWLPHIATLVGCCSPLPFICGVGFHKSPHWSVAAVHCRLYAGWLPHIATLVGCCSPLSFICGVGFHISPHWSVAAAHCRLYAVLASSYRHTGRLLQSIVVYMRCWLPHITTLVGCCSPLPFICGVGFLISPHWSVAAVHCRLYVVLASSYRHTGRLLQSIVVYMRCWLPYITTRVGCCSPLSFICGVGFHISPHLSVAAVLMYKLPSQVTCVLSVNAVLTLTIWHTVCDLAGFASGILRTYRCSLALHCVRLYIILFVCILHLYRRSRNVPAWIKLWCKS